MVDMTFVIRFNIERNQVVEPKSSKEATRSVSANIIYLFQKTKKIK